MLGIDDINRLEKENESLKSALGKIEGLCKETNANVNMYGYERDYTYKAILEHNNKILKVIKGVKK